MRERTQTIVCRRCGAPVVTIRGHSLMAANIRVCTNCGYAWYVDQQYGGVREIWPGRKVGWIVEPIITVGDYILWRQPDVFWLFREYGLNEEMTTNALALRQQVRESYIFDWWRRLMEERPKPGRGGLLPGEELP